MNKKSELFHTAHQVRITGECFVLLGLLYWSLGTYIGLFSLRWRVAREVTTQERRGLVRSRVLLLSHQRQQPSPAFFRVSVELMRSADLAFAHPIHTVRQESHQN